MSTWTAGGDRQCQSATATLPNSHSYPNSLRSLCRPHLLIPAELVPTATDSVKRGTSGFTAHQPYKAAPPRVCLPQPFASIQRRSFYSLQEDCSDTASSWRAPACKVKDHRMLHDANSLQVTSCRQPKMPSTDSPHQLSGGSGLWDPGYSQCWPTFSSCRRKN